MNFQFLFELICFYLDKKSILKFLNSDNSYSGVKSIANDKKLTVIKSLLILVKYHRFKVL